MSTRIRQAGQGEDAEPTWFRKFRPETTEAERNRRRTWRVYFLALTGLLLVAIPLTTVSTVGRKLSADVVLQIASTCRDYPVLYCDPSTRDEETSYDHYPFSVNDLTNRTNHIAQNLWVLAFFVDLLEPQQLHDKLTSISPGPNANVWSSFLETFYRSGIIVDRFKLYYGTLADYLLPILFGMLGAVTFGLRELRQKTDPPIAGRRGGVPAVLRICIAGLAGYLVTVTADLVPALQISQIFVAFVLGYSIDVFFALLDRAVLRIKSTGLGHGPDEPPADGPRPVHELRNRPRQVQG